MARQVRTFRSSWNASARHQHRRSWRWFTLRGVTQVRTISALGGLVLLIVGITVLMERLGPEFDTMAVLRNYWPVAVIAVGLPGTLRLATRPTAAIIGPLVVIAVGCARGAPFSF